MLLHRFLVRVPHPWRRWFLPLLALLLVLGCFPASGAYARLTLRVPRARPVVPHHRPTPTATARPAARPTSTPRPTRRPAPPVQPSTATSVPANPRINTFYTITKAAYTVWQPHSHTPPRTSSFPQGTTAIAYYIRYHNVAAHTTRFQVLIYDHSGAVYATGIKHPFPHASGEQLNFFGSSTPFDDGFYRMNLIVDGVVAWRTTFTVGR